MITVATLFWSANPNSQSFSCCYTEAWVEKLYRGFARNLTQPFRFVCYSEKDRLYKEPIVQKRLSSLQPDYGHCVQPYEMDEPMILVGLDTIITGNIDHLADYCLSAEKIALPIDPYHTHQACNGVALVPKGMARVWQTWDGQNDMDHVRSFPHELIDRVFPGQVKSYKGHIKKEGLGDVRIVYFHGAEKPETLGHIPWVQEHWR